MGITDATRTVTTIQGPGSQSDEETPLLTHPESTEVSKQPQVWKKPRFFVLVEIGEPDPASVIHCCLTNHLFDSPLLQRLSSRL